MCLAKIHNAAVLCPKLSNRPEARSMLIFVSGFPHASPCTTFRWATGECCQTCQPARPNERGCVGGERTNTQSKRSLRRLGLNTYWEPPLTKPGRNCSHPHLPRPCYSWRSWPLCPLRLYVFCQCGPAWQTDNTRHMEGLAFLASSTCRPQGVPRVRISPSSYTWAPDSSFFLNAFCLNSSLLHTCQSLIRLHICSLSF